MKRFCKKCGFELPEKCESNHEDGNTYYKCISCEWETIGIESEYEIGDEVFWQDPAREDHSEVDFFLSCMESRSVTDILRIDGDTVGDIVYELDYETEVYGRELLRPVCLALTEIKWDCDEDVKLPTKAIISVPSNFKDFDDELRNEWVCNYLSDKYGWCVESHDSLNWNL